MSLKAGHKLAHYEILEPIGNDISPDGQRFLMLKELDSHDDDSTTSRQLRIVQNFAEELKRLVPTEK